MEAGRWLVVASTNGTSGVIAPDGTVVASADKRTTAVLVERVGLTDELTPAIRLGAWPARLFTGFSIVGLLLGALAYRRKRDDVASDRVDAALGGAAEPAPSPAPSEARVG